MTKTRKRTPDQPPKREPKSAEQRKEDFEKKQRDAGRRAVIVHLSADARHNLTALRRIGRLSKAGPTTNADVLESLLTSATTMAAIENAQPEIAAAKPRTRGAAAERAQALFKKVDALLSDMDLEAEVLADHRASRYGWACAVACEVMDEVRAGADVEDLQWYFYDLIDDYVMDLLDDRDLMGGASANDRDTLAWVRAQLGLRREG